MKPFALFRLPGQSSYTLVRQEAGQPDELRSASQLEGRSGFVIAPFAPSDECPLLLLRPDTVETHPCPGCDGACGGSGTAVITGEEDGHTTYTHDFAAFHAQLENGRFDKLVLSRRSVLTTDEEIPAYGLFETACRLYPRTFVTLFATERSGMWLTATPEILVSGEGRDYTTMALAGTMELTGERLSFDTPGSTVGQKDIVWSAKNRAEQHFVETYIENRIRSMADRLEKQGPYTARAGNLVHLRTDFRFRLAEGHNLCAIVDRLHPTPAVCGIPKEAAREFILQNESHDRSYYSGFSGPFGIGGATRLFVSLRCMNIAGRRFTLYAGGGLLRESDERHEWEETQAKMETMRKVICTATRRM